VSVPQALLGPPPRAVELVRPLFHHRHRQLKAGVWFGAGLAAIPWLAFFMGVSTLGVALTLSALFGGATWAAMAMQWKEYNHLLRVVRLGEVRPASVVSLDLSEKREGHLVTVALSGTDQVLEVRVPGPAADLELEVGRRVAVAVLNGEVALYTDQLGVISAQL
jgi:hypothetical protein